MTIEHRFDLPFAALYVPALLGLVTATGCVVEPPPAVVRPESPPPNTNVYFYPAQGHPTPSPEQQDRDRYECNTWAVQQSGFDPSLPNMPPHERVRFVAGPPPGAGVAFGAVTGAILGAAVSDSGAGALVGGLAGAAIGGAAEAESAAEAERLEAQANSNLNGARNANLERKAFDFRRAISACLEGRGYVVK
jgi:hypothetical protein